MTRFLERPAGFASILFVLLMAANLLYNPSFAMPRFVAGSLGIAVPIMIAAMAATPAILSGGGGIDLSTGPLMGLVNILMVVLLLQWDVGTPLVAVPLALLVGAAVGACCGLLVAQIRLQPIVATLGVFLVLNGVNLALMPSPTGPAPGFFADLSGRWHGVPVAPVFLLGPFLIWWALGRTPFVRTLLAVGGDDRVAFSAGIDVRLVRLVAYAIGGLFAAFAGLALTALIQSGDATVGPPFTLQAVTAVALGGTSLAGGRGGMTGSVLGALCLFLIQNLLTNMNVSIFWVQIVFGVVLVLALIVNAGLRRLPRAA